MLHLVWLDLSELLLVKSYGNIFTESLDNGNTLMFNIYVVYIETKLNPFSSFLGWNLRVKLIFAPVLEKKKHF